MLSRIIVNLQYLIPQHLLSRGLGLLAELKIKWLKNLMIGCFIKLYSINISETEKKTPYDYETFNLFFIRKLKSSARPMDQNPSTIISPADSFITEYGDIQNNQLLQVKGHSLNIENLLVKPDIYRPFINGQFITLYLAPNHYHRVHMPLSGKLIKSLFVPGKLFSVNTESSKYIPELFIKNERLITIFETNIGKVAIILVGALVVGAIETVWSKKVYHEKNIMEESIPPNLFLKKGEELSLFKVGGSTVILIVERKAIQFTPNLSSLAEIKVGQAIADITHF